MAPHQSIPCFTVRPFAGLEPNAKAAQRITRTNSSPWFPSWSAISADAPASSRALATCTWPILGCDVLGDLQQQVWYSFRSPNAFGGDAAFCRPIATVWNTWIRTWVVAPNEMTQHETHGLVMVSMCVCVRMCVHFVQQTGLDGSSCSLETDMLCTMSSCHPCPGHPHQLHSGSGNSPLAWKEKSHQSSAVFSLLLGSPKGHKAKIKQPAPEMVVHDAKCGNLLPTPDAGHIPLCYLGFIRRIYSLGGHGKILPCKGEPFRNWDPSMASCKREWLIQLILSTHSRRLWP